MKPWAYYNEIEPAAAHVLRALIAANVIAPGEVDERSIIDVRPDDLRGFSQCHFFAGGGLWSVAARLAGWPDDRPLWTGSCPCQPFSVAGKGRGADDPRHLWPDFFRLIRTCRPPVVVGEQVAGAAGYGWFDGVSADLEGEGYASRAVDIPACAVDAPHIRQRLYWVADANGAEPRRGQFGFQPEGRCDLRPARDGERSPRSLVDAARIGRGEGRAGHAVWKRDGSATAGASFWHDAELRVGADGKARRVKPGIRLLVARFSDALDAMRAVERQAWEGIVTHGESNGNADETMRILRQAIFAQASRQEAAVGMRVEFHATQILLDFLLCVSATRGGTLEPKLVPQACSEARQRIVRSMWSHRTAGGPSCEWRPDEQFVAESSNAVLALSLLLARLVAPYWEAARDAYAASNRVGMLRIGGNAIVAPLAAEVLAALMEPD